MNFFRRIVNSIKDIKSYRYFANQSSKNAFVYFIFFVNIIAALWIFPTAFKSIDWVSNFSKELTHQFDSNVPEFKLSNGQLEVFAEMPLVITNDAESIIVIDTTGQTTREILDNHLQGVLVTEDEAIIKQDGVKYREILFKDLKEQEFTKSDLQQLIAKILPYFKLISPTLFISGMTVFIFGSLLFLMILTFIAQILSSVQRKDLTFRNVFNISAHAMTLPLILVLGNSFLDKGIPFLRLFSFVLVGIYQWRAIKIVGTPEGVNRNEDVSNNDIIGIQSSSQTEARNTEVEETTQNNYSEVEPPVREVGK